MYRHIYNWNIIECDVKHSTQLKAQSVSNSQFKNDSYAESLDQQSNPLRQWSQNPQSPFTTRMDVQRTYYFSVGIGGFVIGLGQISFFFSLTYGS